MVSAESGYGRRPGTTDCRRCPHPGSQDVQKARPLLAESDDEWAELINPMPKHVASRTLEGPLTWNSQLLGADIAGEVANLKSRYSGDLILYGIGELANYLARQDLVDE